MALTIERIYKLDCDTQKSIEIEIFLEKIEMKSVEI